MRKLKFSGYRLYAPVLISLALVMSPFSTVFAVIVSCQANIIPATVQPNSQTSYTLNLTNNGSGSINWIQIMRPSANFVINNANWSGTSSTSDDQTTLYGGAPIVANASENISLSVHAGEDQSSGENWTVLVSENSDGSNPTMCSGSLGAAVAGARVPDPDTTAPVIDMIKLTKLKSKSIVVSWVTDEPSNSDVTYGETIDYGQNAHDDTLTTNHSLTLQPLIPDTGYHFYVTSYDPSGNGASSDDSTFLTPETDPLVTVQSPLTPPASTVVPLKAVPTEKIPPTVKIITDISKPQKTMPVITGMAEDNEALAGIFYSTDGGSNWLPVDNATGLGTKKATFSFSPQNLEDGNYALKVYAIDTSSNQTMTPVQTLVIDELPPTVGGSIVAVGSQIIIPDKNNAISSLVGIDQLITLSAVGGPTSVSIFTTQLDSDTRLQEFRMTQSIDSGLWSGVLSYSKAGTYQLEAVSVDGAGNTTSRKLSIASVRESGKITDAKGKYLSAKVAVYVRDVETNSWVLWDGEAYDQPNPVGVSAKGVYAYYLPEGTYYLKIEARGHQTVMTRSFELTSPQAVNGSFVLNNQPGIDIGPVHVHFSLPSFGSIAYAPSKDISKLPKAAFIGSTLPQFSLKQTNNKTITTSDLYGRPTIMTFINTWSSSASSQLESLSSLEEPFLNVATVGSGESLSKLAAYSKISGYTIPIIADRDNQLIQSLGATTVPVTYFIDRHGEVKKVMMGVLSKKEFLDNVAF